MKHGKTFKIAAGLLLLATCLFFQGDRTATADDTNGTAIPNANIKIEYLNETMTVTTNKDSIIYYTDSYSDNLEKWYSCEVRNNKAVFDISWVKTTATTRLYLCGDVQTKVTSRDVVWQEKLKATFTGTLLSTDITEAETWLAAYAAYPNFTEDTGYFVFTVKEDNREKSYFSLENLEWRKGDSGVFRDFSELDLREMNIKGISLQFRIKGKDETTGGDGTGYRSSSLAKVSVAKLAVAPSTELDAKLTSINIKNGMEYSLDGVNWTLVPDYYKRATSAEYMVSQADRDLAIAEITTTTKVAKVLLHWMLGEKSNQSLNKSYMMNYSTTERMFNNPDKNLATGIYIYVRDVATVKRAASKIAKIFVPFSEEVNTDWKNGFAVKDVESKTGTGGVQVENSSDGNYQVAILTPEEQAEITDWDNIDISNLKWTTIKAGKTLKLAYTKVPKGSVLLYRMAGEEDMLPTTYLRTEPINYNAITYAAISSTTYAVGDVLNAVISTNVNLADVTCHWQRCSDIKAENPTWTEITTGATYTVTEADIGSYLRIYFDEASGTWESNPVGPVK